MRRALLSIGPTVGPPFTVGESDTSATIGTFAPYLLWTISNPAPRSGTITSVKIGSRSGPYVVRVLTGTGSSASFTPTATTGDLTVASGLNTFAVSLPIPAGGLIAVWNSSNAYGVGMHAGAAGFYYNNLATAPTVGNTYAGTGYGSYVLALQGAGA